MCANGCNTEIEEFMLLASEFEREAKSLEVRQNTDRLDAGNSGVGEFGRC
jgi:hypothetical protein